MVIGGQVHKNVGIRCPNRGRITVREIDAAGGQTYVVNDVQNFARRYLLSNRLLDLITKIGGFFDAHSRRSPPMKFGSASVYAGKEVPAQPREQNCQRAKATREERNQENPPVMEARFQHAAKPDTKPLKSRLKTLLKPYQRVAAGGISLLFFSPQQVLCHGRNDRPRKEIRHQPT